MPNQPSWEYLAQIKQKRQKLLPKWQENYKEIQKLEALITQITIFLTQNN